MNHTLRHIEYLISRHECLIMPGIGAILSRYEGARFSADGRSLLPPTRHFSFNADIKENDGLLAHSIARSMSLSYERAVKVMNDELDALRHQLEVDGELSLGSVGRLCYDKNDKIISFEANQTAASAMISWLPTVQPTDIFKKARLEDEENEIISRRRRISPVGAFVRAACILIAFIALGVALTTPITVENADYASLSLPEIKMPAKAEVKTTPQLTIYKQPNEFQPVDTAARAQYQRERAAAKSVSSTTKVEVAQPIAEQPKPVFSSRFNDSDSYCVVVASLVTREEAEDFAAKESRRNKSAQYGVMDKDGRYRVYVATGSTMAQAKAQANAWSGRYRGAWVCAR